MRFFLAVETSEPTEGLPLFLGDPGDRGIALLDRFGASTDFWMVS